MVRGNWQKRVEKAHDRRKEARQKKVRKENRAHFKALVQNQLWPLLDKFTYETIALDRGIGVEKLHIWVDQLPSSRNVSCVDDEDDESVSSKRSNKRELKKGNSNLSGSGVGKKKKGYESPAVKKEKNKKVHPRSHEQNIEEDSNVEDEPLLCRKYFFNGQYGGASNGGSKKNSHSSQNKYPHVQYSTKRHLTLFQALSPPKNQRLRSDSTASNSGSSYQPRYDEKKRQDVLHRASNAAAMAQLKLDNVDAEVPEDSVALALKEISGIDMLHYLEIPLMVTSTDSEEVNVTDLVAKALAAEEVPIASIAYVSFKQLLIFDRFDDGKVLDSDIEDVLLGIGKDDKQSKRSADGGIQDFPSTVLEHILMFLPDHYSGLLTFVCKNFYREIGTGSPWLWKSLLQRHNWPTPEEIENMQMDTYASPVQLHKQCFISHYKVCHRIDLLVNGIRSMVESSDNIGDPRKDTAIYRFRDQDKSFPFVCNNLKLWSDDRVLTTCPENCTLQLYEVSKQDESTNTLKEVLCTRIAPLPNSKKKKCLLESMDMDDRYIMCSFTVGDRSVLTTIKREDLLSNSTEDCIECNDEDSDLHEIDLTSDIMEHDPGLFSIEGNMLGIDEVCAKLESRIHACGNGIFVAIVGLHVYTGPSISMRLATGILSFTATKGKAIRGFEMLPPGMHDEKTILRTNFQYKKRNDPTIIICKDLLSGTFLSLIGDRRGKITMKCQLEDNLSEDPSLDFQMTQHHLHTLYLATEDDDEISRKHAYISTISLEDLTQGSDLSDINALKIAVEIGCDRVLSMKCVGNDYVMLILSTQNGMEFDAHWFGEQEDDSNHVVFSLLHIPSGREIHRSTLLLDIEDECDEILFDSKVSASHFAVSVVINEVGLIISGDKMHEINDDELSEQKDKTPKNKKTKKKKRLAAKIGSGGKKDGFARGMSMRG